MKQTSKHLSTTYWNKSLKKLVELCEDRGWTVEFSKKEDAALTQTDKIVINKTRSKENMFYMLLHELGHFLVCSGKDYEKKFRAVFVGKEHKKYGTLSYRVGIVEEELAAWKAGYQFAINNNFTINEDRFNKIKSRMIASYMRWVVKNNNKHYPTTNNKKDIHDNTINIVLRKEPEGIIIPSNTI